MTSLAERLQAIRRQRFVGRQAEIQLFLSQLESQPPDLSLLFFYGPGGTGKTSLLRHFAQLAAERNLPATYLDCRQLEPEVEALKQAAAEVSGLPNFASLQQTAPGEWGRRLLLLDTYELFDHRDDEVREEFLARLPTHFLIVLAGRHPPRLAWRSDPGWRLVSRAIPLRNFKPEESVAFLKKNAVPDGQQAEILAITHGHPLALSLVAEQHALDGDGHLSFDGAPNLIRQLVDHLLDSVPSRQHRAALEASALIRLTSEPLLAAMVGTEDGSALFTWLASLSFVDQHQRGVFPHDLAREALTAELRWRNFPRYKQLHAHARVWYMEQFERVGEREQRQILADYVFLHRDNPNVRPFFEWQGHAGLRVEPVTVEKTPQILQMVRQHEGGQAARLAEFWLQAQPEGGLMLLDTASDPAGGLIQVSLEQLSASQRTHDPAITRAWAFLERQAPLRPGERATHFRFWLSAADHQAISAVQSRLFVLMVQHYLTTPGLAYTFLPVSDPDFWEPVFVHVDLQRLPELDFEVEGRRFGVFGHDWRVRPPLQWLALMAERETESAPPTSPQSAEPPIVLSKVDFEAAVRSLLKQFNAEPLLKMSPLLRSRLIEENAADPVHQLRQMVLEVLEGLKATPRQRKLFRAVYHTWIQPTGTQEKTAELLDLPFSTYRRHLKSGVDYVSNALWAREIGWG